MRRVLLSLLALPGLVGVAVPARAEIALLANGQVLKLASHRAEGAEVVLVLRGGGEMGVPPSAVTGFVPDEVLDEVAAGSADDLRALATSVARRHGLDPALVLAVVSVESAFQPKAVSRKGAQGLMQLMPGTAASLGVGDAFDAEQNLDGGARHLG
ncbi:MAG TPA: lytic transglycosylase domain-containing protein, partial [Gemmatimonadales bacterium]|nr:lytic transglycosylase domain-containing protein [Gemmatimonadales bacterium]